MNADTEKTFPFTVDGKPLALPDEKVPARVIIERAKDEGIPAAQGKIEDLALECKGSICSGDDVIDLSRDDTFSIKVTEGEKVYQFKVNGQELEADFAELAVLDIIKIAQEKGVPLPGEPENLLLQKVGEKDGFKGDDLVKLGGAPEFLLILDASTPVA